MLGEFDSADFDSVNYVPSECPIWRNYSVGLPHIVMFQPAPVDCGAVLCRHGTGDHLNTPETSFEFVPVVAVSRIGLQFNPLVPMCQSKLAWCMSARS
jgi:hypothetical protein